MIIRETTPEDAEALRELRLFSLQDTPYAFGMDYETQIQIPAEEWKSRCVSSPTNTYFVWEVDGRLLGMARVSSDGRPKTGHVGTITSVFVHPEARGHGVAKRLITTCLDWAREKELARVTLSVAAVNTAAIRLYIVCGFSVYGVDPDVIRIGADSYDELLMHCWVNTAG
jgi:ribosomal protein S18 acetylase RimI-like enzyme